MSESYDEAVKSIKRMQEFDASKLPRVSDLGNEINFTDAVDPADKIIGLYQRVSVEALKDFPDGELDTIKNNADADFNRFQQILDFKLAQANPENQKNSFIQQLVARYQPLFKELRDIISYSACRTTDFRLIEQQARGVFQSITDKSNEIQKDLNESRDQASTILDDIRKVAAEQGVSQQATYFKDEHNEHEKLAEVWMTRTIGMAIILAMVSVGFVFLSKWEWLAPSDGYEAMQLIASKAFVFATMTYLLYLCGKNYMSHRHNSVLNKHRQNALLTYKAMSDASKTQECREIVLAQAAYCMYNPQDTGYIKVVPGSDSGMKTFVDSIPKTTVRVDG